MIKLKDIISEIEHFRKFDQSKIRWGVEENKEKFFVRMYLQGYKNPYKGLFVGKDMGVSDNDPEWFGGIALSKINSGQRMGYLTVIYADVTEPNLGFGKVLFKKTLEELKKRNYHGVAISKKDARSRNASHLLGRIVNFSDGHFDYVNV